VNKSDKRKCSRMPLVITDPELNKLQDTVLFPAKVEKAKEITARLRLPEVSIHESAKANK